MKHYTFNFVCSFSLQFTVPEKDVEQEPSSPDGMFQPTEGALIRLQQELKEYLQGDYAVDNVEVYADSDSLLGTDDFS
jgi:hypothetical protein